MDVSLSEVNRCRQSECTLRMLLCPLWTVKCEETMACCLLIKVMHTCLLRASTLAVASLGPVHVTIKLSTGTLLCTRPSKQHHSVRSTSSGTSQPTHLHVMHHAFWTRNAAQLIHYVAILAAQHGQLRPGWAP